MKAKREKAKNLGCNPFVAVRSRIEIVRTVIAPKILQIEKTLQG
jgi:hypothetical protein